MTLCPPCTQILNDIDTCRQRLWKKAFIGVVVSTLPMDWNTRPPGSPHPLPCVPPPPHPVPWTLGMEDNVGWGPRPCLRYSHCPLPSASVLPSSPRLPSSGWCGLGWVFIEGLQGVGADDLASWSGLGMSV